MAKAPKYFCARDPDWMILREYICPKCEVMLEKATVPPGYPIILNFLPNEAALK